MKQIIILLAITLASCTHSFQHEDEVHPDLVLPEVGWSYRGEVGNDEVGSFSVFDFQIDSIYCVVALKDGRVDSIYSAVIPDNMGDRWLSESLKNK